MTDAPVHFSITYDGVTWSTEAPINYGGPGQFGQRFIARRIGYVNNYFAFKLRWVSTERMSFAAGVLWYA